MALILTHVFACCLSRKHNHQDDEESHLIPPNTEIVPSYSSSPGPQIFRDRMLDIVRSKESKMVNVGTTSPFHFHNKPIKPSSSSNDPVPLPVSSDPFFYSPKYAPSSSGSRFRTRSSSSSVAFPNSGFNENDEEEEDHDDKRRSGSRTQAFNIRLVRAGASANAGASSTGGIRRGRPRTKPASSDEDDDPGSQPEPAEPEPAEPTTMRPISSLSLTINPDTDRDTDIGPLIITWGD